MKLVLFTHPSFLGSQSMERFASMLANGMQARGHQVEIWSPKGIFSKLPLPQGLKKWMGYIDQYIVFKFYVKRKLSSCGADTIFIFADHALGPWVPWIKGRPNVIHCHDFLAQRSALGQIVENPTKWFGRQYQAYICSGYNEGKNFISVSQKTRDDLTKFLIKAPLISEVVYNGLSQLFKPGDVVEARALLGAKTNINLTGGYILHIGGNQWYKNRLGVIEMYDAFTSNGNIKLPLLLIGQEPDEKLLDAHRRSEFKDSIHFLSAIGDELLRTAYVGASVFVFPSLAEGFGWPIAEAMASGCMVITTNEDPMKEVAGYAGFLIDRMPYDAGAIKLWAVNSAKIMSDALKLADIEKQKQLEIGIENSKRFDADVALDNIEAVYYKIAKRKNA